MWGLNPVGASVSSAALCAPSGMPPPPLPCSPNTAEAEQGHGVGGKVKSGVGLPREEEIWRQESKVPSLEQKLPGTVWL